MNSEKPLDPSKDYPGKPTPAESRLIAAVADNIRLRLKGDVSIVMVIREGILVSTHSAADEFKEFARAASLITGSSLAGTINKTAKEVASVVENISKQEKPQIVPSVN